MTAAMVNRHMVENPTGKPTWKTRDGQTLLIEQMEEEHLRNAISFVQRRLVAEFGRTPWIETIHPLLKSMDNFLTEAKRRGLRV